MKPPASRTTFISCFALALAAGACSEPSEPELGTLVIRISTVGGDPDLDGYTLIVDGQEPMPVGLFSTVTLRDLSAGEHQVALEDYAANCDLTRAPLRPVTVLPNETVRVDIEVLCYPTGIAVMTATSGPDFDPDGYILQFGQDLTLPISVVGVVTRSRLAPGSYSVTLSGLAANCQVAGEPTRTVQVEFRKLASVIFEISCTATTGVVEVTSTTVGPDPDLTGYEVRLDEAQPQQLQANQIGRFRGVPVGTHTLSIGDVAPNCALAGTPERNVTVTGGGLSQDTVRVLFEVSCARAEKIAFVRGIQIMVSLVDGSDAAGIASGWKSAPSWSPEGDRIVYQWATCYYDYYYYDYCYDAGLAVSRSDGTDFRALSQNSADRHPAWSPDGQTIAFEREGRIHLISPLGTSKGMISLPVIRATQPDWHPTANRLVFTCEVVAGNLDICSVLVDGSGFQRLTTGSEAETEPDWSPDGTRIALTTTRFSTGDVIGVMAAQGGSVTTILPGSAPAWSPDGTRILFQRTAGGIATIRPDGTALMIISTVLDAAPSWRP